jgi:hypothetical protein
MFQLDVNYILNHLDMSFLPAYELLKNNPKTLVDGKSRSRKIARVLRKVETNQIRKIKSIRLVLHRTKDEFRIDDGVPELAVFSIKKIPKIYAKVRIGTW